MKNVVFILLVCSSLTCCNVEKKNKFPEQKIEMYLKELLLKEYPNYKSNAIVVNDLKNTLVKQIDSIANMGNLQDFVMEINKIKKNPHGEGVMVQFNTKSFPSNESLSKQVKFDLISFMNEDLAKSLNENVKYLVYAKKYKRLDEEQTYIITDKTYNSPEMQILKSDYLGAVEIKLGVFYCEVDSVKRVSPTEYLRK